jgi:hypothetical protein
MAKIDKRIHYIIMTDTETCNTLVNEKGGLDMSSTFVYDIGWAVCDKRGNIYETKSYIVDDIFNHEKELMESAYYSSKIPQYLEQIAKGERVVASYYEIRKDFLDTMARYNTNTVCAHNSRFDYNATNTTQRWLTKSKYRYFFPKDVEIWDTLKMARDVVIYTKSYKAFCEKNGYMTKHKTPRPRATAEIIYRYITGNEEFIESHTALEDVLIEVKILAYCFSKHKAMAKGLWEKSKRNRVYKRATAVI